MDDDAAQSARQIAELEALVARLRLELDRMRETNGSDPREQLSLEEIETELRAACARLEDGDASAQEDFDALERIYRDHPEKLAADARAEQEWHAREDPINTAALSLLRRFVPADIRSTSRSALDALPPALADRVWSKKALWLIRTPRDAIARTHVADLTTQFAPHRLDLVELRALVAALPDASEFENDRDGAKANWRDGIEQKLRDAIDKVATAPAESLRAAVYFDSDTWAPHHGVYAHECDEDAEAGRELAAFVESAAGKHRAECEKKRQQQEQRSKREPLRAPRGPGGAHAMLAGALQQQLAARLGSQSAPQPPIAAALAAKFASGPQVKAPRTVQAAPCAVPAPTAASTPQRPSTKQRSGAVAAMLQRFEAPQPVPTPSVARARAAALHREASATQLSQLRCTDVAADDNASDDADNDDDAHSGIGPLPDSDRGVFAARLNDVLRRGPQQPRSQQHNAERLSRSVMSQSFVVVPAERKLQREIRDAERRLQELKQQRNTAPRSESPARDFWLGGLLERVYEHVQPIGPRQPRTRSGEPLANVAIEKDEDAEEDGGFVFVSPPPEEQGLLI